MTWDTVQQLVRIILQLVAGWLLSRGFITEEKMLRVYAKWIVASMANQLLRINRPVVQVPRKSVREHSPGGQPQAGDATIVFSLNIPHP